MARKRGYTRRRKTYGRRRNYRRRFKTNTRYSKRGQKLYLFKRFTGAYGQLVISSLTATYAGYEFALRDLPNYTEFTALYDMYKINAVKISFIPQMTQNVSLGAINNPEASTRFFSVIDYNDSAAPASVDELREYQSCKITPILRTHKRYIYKPKVLDSVLSSRNPWMATSNPSQPFFGLKVAVEPMFSSTTTVMNYNIEAKFYMSFKNVK